MSSRRLATLVGLVALLLATAVLFSNRDEHRNQVEVTVPRQPDSAGAFVDSIGVAMHLHYVDTAYARQADVFARLRELGVRHIREGAPVRAPELAKGLREAARLGIGATLVTDIGIQPADAVAAGLREMRGRIDGFEGPNELDLGKVPDWQAQLRIYQPGLRAAAATQAPGVPVVGPSFLDPGHYDDVDAASFDAASLHPYSGALPPEATLEEQLRRAHEVAPQKQVLFTETGFHNALAATVGQPPTSEEAAADYLPRALLWAFAHGVERTFVYELLDELPEPALRDPEQHFGLLRQDFSPKPAFLALRNMIRAVSQSPGPAGVLAPFPKVESRVHVEVVVLRRPDGSRLVALWRPVPVWDRDGRRPIEPVPATATVTWPRAARDLSVLRPSLGEQPVTRHASATRLQLAPAGDVVLLSYR
ncbi:MAG: hypothetical protein QOE06_580 [Thermoleophilaceae bacterium]|nr:hypothetical protein [Thermoleophilaceae bacterium]